MSLLTFPPTPPVTRRPPQVDDEDGGRSSLSRLSFMLSYNTSTSVSSRTAAHEYDMWTDLLAVAAGGTAGATAAGTAAGVSGGPPGLPLLPPSSFAAAATSAQLLQLLRVGAEPGPGILLASSQTALGSHPAAFVLLQLAVLRS